MSDTIFAQATARGRAGVAIIRLSGPDAFAIAATLVGDVPKRGLRLIRFEDQIIDQALILRFSDGASFTGEPVVEFHCHGSVAVVSALLAALGRSGARMAEPGEFTRRALANGCLDLAQVEGLADLIEAETEAQRRQALDVMQGSLSGKVGAWRKALVRAGALIEATIDFADEDVPVDVMPEVTALMQSVERDIQAEIKGSFAAERIRDGFEIAIVGPPNAGKSSLLNALAGREAAITSEIAGTTRDVIEVRMDIGGYAVTLLDMAGLRETEDQVEAVGVARAQERANAADLRVFLTEDGTVLDEYVRPMPEDIVAISKADTKSIAAGLMLSSVSGAGLDELLAQLATRLDAMTAPALSASNARHRAAMETALDRLRRADVAIAQGLPEELVAAELRQSTLALASLIGEVGVEDLLDDIFSSFCIGK